MIEVTLYENDANMGTIEVNDSKEFPLALTKSNSDIRDITKRQGVYTKDFKVLATSKNNRLLKYIYNANATAIGGRDCSISYNGMPILTGLIFATKVEQRNQAEEYTLRIYSDRVDWHILLGNATIKDYDYGNSEVASFGMSNGQLSGVLPANATQSTLSRAYIEASWRFPNLFDYVYPLISYGQPDNGTFVAETDMRPAIYIGKMLTKAFASIGYTLDSDFFSTGDGSKLILPFINDGFVQPSSYTDLYALSAEQTNQVDLAFGQFQSTFQGRLPLNVDINDPSNQYDTSLFQIDLVQSGDYVIDLLAIINLRAFSNIVNITLANVLDFYVGVREVGSLTDKIRIYSQFFNTPSVNIFGGTIQPNGQPVRFEGTSTTLFLEAGTYEYYVSFKAQSITEVGTGGAQSISLRAGIGSTIEFTMQPEIVKGQSYTVSNVLSDTKVLDVIRGLQNIFNLYFDTNNNERTVTIEPKPALVKPISQGTDLSGKLDVENRITTDIIQNYNRSLQFRYANDSNDGWMEGYNQQQGTIYGSALYDLGSDFKDGITELGTRVFAATALYEQHPFTTSRCPIPVMWKENAPSPPKNYKFLPRVLYYKGYVPIEIEPFVGPVFTTTSATWNWIDTVLKDIPSSFMLDPDLNAPVDVNLLYNDDTNRNGLVRTYYNGDVAIIHDRRVHRAYFKITGIDFRNLDLFQPIYLDHVNLQGWYYVNQVIDFTPNKEKTTLYELVKAFDTLPIDRPIVTEIPTIQGGTRQLSAIGGGTLTGSGKQSFESLVGFNGSGNVGIIRGGGTVLGNGNIQTVTDQHIFGNYNFGNESTWIVGLGLDNNRRYNGLQLTTAGVFKVHGGTVRTIVNGVIQDVYATIEGNLETVHLTGNGG